MTICNMSIEWGAKAGLIAPDETTFDYLEGRPHAPSGRRLGRGRRVLAQRWHRRRRRRSTARSCSTRRAMAPFVTWGTNPGQGVPLSGARARARRLRRRRTTASAAERALTYMDLEPGTPMRDIDVDTVFLGSCTNGRIEDLRAAAAVVSGRRVADDTRMLVVPGSTRVRLQAEAEGLDVVFKDAGRGVARRRLLDVPRA